MYFLQMKIVIWSQTFQSLTLFLEMSSFSQQLLHNTNNTRIYFSQKYFLLRIYFVWNFVRKKKFGKQRSNPLECIRQEWWNLEQFKEIIYLCTLLERNKSMKMRQNAPVLCQVIQCEICHLIYLVLIVILGHH